MSPNRLRAPITHYKNLSFTASHDIWNACQRLLLRDSGKTIDYSELDLMQA